MINKWNLFYGIFQLIIAFVILMINNEKMYRWILTLFFSILFLFNGIMGIIDYKRNY